MGGVWMHAHLRCPTDSSSSNEAPPRVLAAPLRARQVWEFGIPVQIKYIADPGMHAISAVSVTPNKKWWCGQSMDNQSTCEERGEGGGGGGGVWAGWA